jgi:serine/threonine-protein kinase HipA
VGEEALRRLFQAASSPGGARPKLVIRHHGRDWIAKLGSSRDRFDMVRVEAASLALAADAGIAVPSFRIETFAGRTALLVERFDITPGGGRHHVLSLRTLLGAEGFYHLGYPDLADCLRRVSARPEDDMPALYRQMAFNAVLGNTDDHLKNFALRRLPEGWRLTPAYDLLPDVLQRGEHCLHFGAPGTRPSLRAVRDLGGAFGLSRPRVARITDEVGQAVARWRERFADHGVPQSDRDRLARDLDRRLAAS